MRGGDDDPTEVWVGSMIAQSIPFPGGWSAAQQNTPNPPGMQGRVSLSCWIILALVYIPSRNRVEGSGRHAVRFCLEMRGGALGQGGGVGAGPRRIASGKVRETDWPANFLQRNARGGDSGGIGSNGPVSGDCVVRRKVLDERSSRWKAVPLKKWPGEGHTGLRVAETVPEAVEDMLEGACSRVYVGEGRHSWDGSRLIVGGWRAEERCPEEGTYPRGEDAEHTLAVGGDLHARMWGMWVLEPHARGEFAGVTLAHAAAPGPSEPTFQVWHGPWVFQDCDLRSTCGVALQGIMRADISCVGCSIGGLDAGERDEYGDWVGTTDYVSGDESRAVFGVSLADLAAADLVMCTVEYTGLVHAACMSLASSTLRLNSCLVHSNSIGVYMDDSAAVQVGSCSPPALAPKHGRPCAMRGGYYLFYCHFPRFHLSLADFTRVSIVCLPTRSHLAHFPTMIWAPFTLELPRRTALPSFSTILCTASYGIINGVRAASKKHSTFR